LKDQDGGIKIVSFNQNKSLLEHMSAVKKPTDEDVNRVEQEISNEAE